MQLRLEILQRFIPSLLVGTEADEAGDLEEVYSKFISGGQMQLRLGIWHISGGQKQLRLGIWKRFIPSLFVGDRSSLS